jgi:hypothetical protein
MVLSGQYCQNAQFRALRRKLKSSAILRRQCTWHSDPRRVTRKPRSLALRTWRAYVEVNVQGDHGCLRTTRLWVARGNRPHRLIYLIPAKVHLAEASHFNRGCVREILTPGVAECALSVKGASACIDFSRSSNSCSRLVIDAHSLSADRCVLQLQYSLIDANNSSRNMGIHSGCWIC